MQTEDYTSKPNQPTETKPKIFPRTTLGEAEHMVVTVPGPESCERKCYPKNNLRERNNVASA